MADEGSRENSQVGRYRESFILICNRDASKVEIVSFDHFVATGSMAEQVGALEDAHKPGCQD